MTKLRLSSTLKDIDKPEKLKSLRHRISKKQIEEYYTKIEGDEEEQEWDTYT